MGQFSRDAPVTLAATLTFAPAVSAHEDNEAEEASSEHFLGVN
jgi:hypothetical protein